MIGTVVLDNEKIKEVVGAYYKDYKNVCVNLTCVNRKENTGIVITHTEQIKNNVNVNLQEELEIKDLQEIFTDLFKNLGYVATNIRLNHKHSGSGYGESTKLEGIVVSLNKLEKVKQKTL